MPFPTFIVYITEQNIMYGCYRFLNILYLFRCIAEILAVGFPVMVKQQMTNFVNN